MSSPSFPLFAAVLFSPAAGTAFVGAKMLSSSLIRSLFCGDQKVFHNRPGLLFKCERRQVEEIISPLPSSGDLPWEQQWMLRSRFFQAAGSLQPHPRQWVVICRYPALALRNIDHLFPGDAIECGSPEPIAFQWVAVEGSAGRIVSPGFWAVRGEFLHGVLKEWEAAQEGLFFSTPEQEAAVWTKVVEGLPLRKRRFEAGEVVAPAFPSVDWAKVCRAAFVTVAGWPKAEEFSFLQALYLGTCLGDETGMMVDLLEA